MEREASRLGVSFREVLNATIRRGLGKSPENDPKRPAPKTRPHSFGFRAGVDLDKLNQLADELEAGAFAARLEAEKRPSAQKTP